MSRMASFWRQVRDDPDFERLVIKGLKGAGLSANAAKREMEKLADVGKAGPPGSTPGLQGILEDLLQKLGDLDTRMTSIEGRLEGFVGGNVSNEQTVAKMLARLGPPNPVAAKAAAATYERVAHEQKAQAIAKRFMKSVQDLPPRGRPRARPTPKDRTEELVRRLMAEASKPIRRRRD